MLSSHEPWPFLKSCVEEGILLPVDLLLPRFLSKQQELSEEQAAFLALMMAQYREGHVCLSWEGEGTLWTMARQGASGPWMQEIMEGAPLPLAPIYSDPPRYYFQKPWTFETEVINHLQRLMQTTPVVPIPIVALEEGFNKQQQEAIERGIRSPVSLIVGGPGTGKTFTAKGLVQQCIRALPLAEKEKFRIVLTAPTGKAVAHLQQQLLPVLEGTDPERILTGTLHALLRVREGDEEETPPILLTDLILVDECSMIDARLWARLLSAVPSGARLVLIGDADQLPAVGMGCFFADLMGVEAILKTRLIEGKRTVDPRLAGLTQALIVNPKTEALAYLREVCVDLTPGVFDKVLEKVAHWWPPLLIETEKSEEWLWRMEQFRLLSCLRQGPWGVDALNARLFSFFRSQLSHEGWWGIPILITKNDEASELYNGDTGVLVRRIKSTLQSDRLSVEDYAVFPGKGVIPALALPPFEYAYCLSVHKSQGSEYKEVVLIVPEGSERFGKEILYTAVTRAKESLSIYGSLACIEQMLGKTSCKRSGLRQRLQGN